MSLTFKYNVSDTIAAISSSGSIGIIRISGNKAFSIADKIFRPRNKILPSNMQANSFSFGDFFDQEKIDEGICLIFRNPHSYTGEDLIEFQIHGSDFILQKLLQVILKNDARAAQPGEFSFRAFMAGKMDLTQAESVANLINAKTEKARKQSLLGLSGELKNKIFKISKKISYVLANITAFLDYPEEGINLEDKALLKNACSNLEKLINSSYTGNIVNKGIKIALIGLPNAGKSSLLNMLLGYERSIVSNIKGTTRDYLEANMEIAGFPITLIDTAGLRDTEDKIEQLGVLKSFEIAENADLIFVLVDGTQEFYLPKIPKIETNNKIIFLQTKVDENTVWKRDDFIKISSKTKIGKEILENKIEQILMQDNSLEEVWLSSERQKKAAQNALVKIKKALLLPEDLAALELQDALEFLAEITGENAKENLLIDIFQNFCVGK